MRGKLHADCSQGFPRSCPPARSAAARGACRDPMGPGCQQHRRASPTPTPAAMGLRGHSPIARDWGHVLSLLVLGRGRESKARGLGHRASNATRWERREGATPLPAPQTTVGVPARWILAAVGGISHPAAECGARRLRLSSFVTGVPNHRGLSAGDCSAHCHRIAIESTKGALQARRT